MHDEAEAPSRFEIHDERDFRGLQNWQIGILIFRSFEAEIVPRKGPH
jgi:hypothetical protein